MASFAAGLALIAQIALIRLLFTADAARVYFLGHPLLIECSLRVRYGIPCPTCGMTRGIVLASHAAFLQAWQISPGACAATLGVLLAGTGLIALAFLHSSRAALIFRNVILTYAAIAVVVWIGGWIAAL